jgi:hypothetical protein
METKSNSSWTVVELSHLYHFIMWGYSNLQIRDILLKENFGRTPDSIANQASMMRKYIIKELGMPVKHWNTGPNTEEKFRKATNAAVPDLILSYKKNKDLVLPRKSLEVVAPIAETAPEPVKPTPTIIPVATKEPDILDVMKMAKELGASEVEYKGMKIKY